MIVCGDTHKVYTKQIGTALFSNVGSAGKPKDGDAPGLLGADPDVARRRQRRLATR